MKPITVETSLDASIKDGSAYSLMMGLGEGYVGACAVFLGASDSIVGLLTSVPVFLGACCQLLSPLLLDRGFHRKPLIVNGAIVQALAWIPMIVAVFVPRHVGIWLLAGGFTLYFASVHFTIPPWLSTMGDLVPPQVRGRYFSGRNVAAIVVQLLGTAAGGIGLSIYSKAGHEAMGFAVIFAGALLSRAVSTWWLTRMGEPPFTAREEARFTLWKFLRQLRTSNFAKFVLFVGCMNAACHFVGSLFNIYFLRILHYDYWEFTAATTVIVAVQILAFPYWGRIADRYGNKNVLKATAVGIVLIPVMWMVSTHILWSCVVQSLAGFCWSGFNMSVQNFVLDAVTPPKRARCTAYLNLFTNSGILAGGIAGAIAINHLPAGGFLPFPFWWLLVISFALRFLVMAIFLPRIREVREIPPVGLVTMLVQSAKGT